jgi:hypothetical protein
MMTQNFRASGKADFDADVAVETLPADGLANNEPHLGTLCHKAIQRGYLVNYMNRSMA